MGNGVDLLKLLEPASRPAGLSGPTSTSKPSTPIESRSFESVLEEARALPADDEANDEIGGDAATKKNSEAKAAGPLAELVRVDRIENESLRRLIGGV